MVPDLSAVQFAVVAGAVLLGTVVQASVGFGAGLFAIPLIVWAGIPAPAAIAMMLSIILIQTGWNCVQYRAEIPWKSTLPLTLLRILFMPLGVWALEALNDSDPARLKQVMGAFLLVVVLSRWGFKAAPRERLHPAWLLLAGSTSGFLAGMLGMGGPPLVLWVTAHAWTARASRGFLWALMLQIIPIQMAVYLWRFGAEAGGAALVGLAYVPIAVAGAVLGERIGRLLSAERLRFAALGILVILAVASIAAPFV